MEKNSKKDVEKGLTAARKGSAGWRKGRDDGSGA